MRGHQVFAVFFLMPPKFQTPFSTRFHAPGSKSGTVEVVQAGRPCLAVGLNCSNPVRILYDAGAIDPNGAFERE